MSRARRVSPVRFDATPTTTEERGGWTVALAYPDEGEGPWLVDLSHRSRWDVQASDIDEQRPLGLEVPKTPGQVALDRGLVISRMNRTQAAVWHVGTEEQQQQPEDASITDVTDGGCMLAVVGTKAKAVMERASSLDLFPPDRKPPLLTQGPVQHIPCQVVTLSSEAVVMAFSRGYGQAFVEALLHSAAPEGLRPGGEAVLTSRVFREDHRAIQE